MTDDTSYVRMMKELLFNNLREIEVGGLKGLPSGFVDLDRITSGWQNSELIVIAGRPAMGKTSLALTIARNAAIDFNKTVALFSLEMSSTQLVNRLISSETEIELEKLRKSKMEEWEWQLLHSKINKLEQSPLIIDDTPSLNILDFRQKCIKLKEELDIQLIIVDYLQLMQGRGGDGKGINDRWQEIGSITRALKSIAKELNVPIIALSQLSRAVESRPGGSKRPMLSDLAESGSIEQDADMVLFLYRPEYYGLDVDEDNNLTQGVAEIIVAKNRNGETGRARLKFVSKYVRFEDLDQDELFSNADSAFTGLETSKKFDNNLSNFIIRPAKMDDIDDEPPF